MRVTLETERLILRNPMPEDYEAMLKWSGDPRVNEFMQYTLYTDALGCKEYIESLDPDEPDKYDLIIVNKETNEPIGMGGIVWHPENNGWELGYNLRYDHWGKGIVPEAMKAIIDYVVSVKGPIHVYGRFCKDNPKSGRVMSKLGMVHTGETSYEKMDGSRVFDCFQYEGDFT